MSSGSGNIEDMSMLDLFKMEAETHCSTLSDDLLALEQDPTSADLLESLMRAAHSIKGAARVVGLDPCVGVAHAMEDVFVAGQAGKLTLGRMHIDALLKGVDMFNDIAQIDAGQASTWFADHADDIAALIKTYADILQGKMVQKEAAPKPAAEKVEAPPQPAADRTAPASSASTTLNLGDMSMLDLFRMEAETHCSTLSDDLLALEQDPTSADLLESLMRAAHSIKGAARVVGLDPCVGLAHAMEDVFVAGQAGKLTLGRMHIDALLKGVDMFNDIAQIDAGQASTWFADHVDDMAALIKTYADILLGKMVQEEAVPKPAAGKVEAPPQPVAEYIAPASSASTTPDLGDMSMLDLFKMEAETHCSTLSDDLLALEQDPTSAKLLESLMRAAHSVKGAARVVGLNPCVGVAHAMEDVFVAGQAGKLTLGRVHIDALLKGVDMLSEIAKLNADQAESWFTDHAGDMEALIKSYADILQGKSVPKAPPSEKKPPVQQVEKRGVPQPVQAAPTKAEQKELDKVHQRRKDDKEANRFIRVSADNMNRLMGLAGETLVESRWLPSFSAELLRLKKRQDELLSIVDKLNSISPEESEKNMKLRENFLQDLSNKIKTCREYLQNDLTMLEDHARHSTEISHRLYLEVIASRMRPFEDGIKGFPRMIRDLSRELGKEVRFDIVGNDTPVDRDILEKIEAPLNHLLRNALDHGIETPDERLAAGKPREAVLRLAAHHRSGMLNIVVSDDGHGIDLEKLRQSIVKKNHVSAEMAVNLNEAELMDFLFLPNFSTRDQVSKVSGRGVGLDVVHSVVHEVNGVVRASSKLGKGTSFEMQLPLTLSVMRALLTEVCDEPYAFPLVAIDHVLKISQASIKEVEGRQYFTFKDKRIGLVSAHQLMGKQTDWSADEFPVIIFSDRFNQYGLIVEKFWGVRDLVVQKLDPRLGKVKDISAAAILEDSTPVLIMDVEDMVRSMDTLISGNRLQRVDDKETLDKKQKRILVADDSITVREVERKMLTAKGYDVEVAVDGMDAWNAMRSGNFNLVVTDVDMPRMNGIELVSMIKNDAKLYNTPVVIVSYKDREEDRQKGLDAGADYYLTKGSFHDQTLVKAVLDLIGGPEGN